MQYSESIIWWFHKVKIHIWYLCVCNNKIQSNNYGTGKATTKQSLKVSLLFSLFIFVLVMATIYTLNMCNSFSKSISLWLFPALWTFRNSECPLLVHRSLFNKCRPFHHTWGIIHLTPGGRIWWEFQRAHMGPLTTSTLIFLNSFHQKKKFWSSQYLCSEDDPDNNVAKI